MYPNNKRSNERQKNDCPWPSVAPRILTHNTWNKGKTKIIEIAQTLLLSNYRQQNTHEYPHCSLNIPRLDKNWSISSSWKLITFFLGSDQVSYNSLVLGLIEDRAGRSVTFKIRSACALSLNNIDSSASWISKAITTWLPKPDSENNPAVLSSILWTISSSNANA